MSGVIEAERVKDGRIVFAVRRGEQSVEWALGSPVDIARLQEAVAVVVEAFENGEFEELVELAAFLSRPAGGGR